MQDFNLVALKQIKRIRRKDKRKYSSDVYETFWKEIEAVLRTRPRLQRQIWFQLEGENVVAEVWQQIIGEYNYNNNVHIFAWLYVPSDGVVIKEHGHKETANGGKQRRKVKEIYVFPDGTAKICKKDEKHSLCNTFGEPIYVLSIKIKSNGIR